MTKNSELEQLRQQVILLENRCQQQAIALKNSKAQLQKQIITAKKTEQQYKMILNDLEVMCNGIAEGVALVGKDLTILNHNQTFKNWAVSNRCDTLIKQNICFVLPELIGYEATIQKIFSQRIEPFSIPWIVRESADGLMCYFDLRLELCQWHQTALLITLIDSTDTAELTQKLHHERNMLRLEINKRKQAEKSLQEINAYLEEKVHERAAKLWLLEEAVSASIDSIVICDALQPNNPLIYANPAFEIMTGYTATEVLGWNCRFLQGDDHHQPEILQLRQAISKGEKCRVVLRNYRRDGTMFWNDLTIYPLHDGQGKLTHFVGIQRDVSQHKRLETGLQGIYELGQKLPLLHDETMIIKRALQTAANLMGTEQMVGYGEVQEETKKLHYRYHYIEGEWWENQATFLLDSDQGIGVSVVRSGKPIYVADVTQEPMHVSGPPWPIGSELNVPLKIDNQVIGVLNVQHSQPNRFSRIDQKLLQTLADQMAVAIKNARLYKAEHEQRLELQKSQAMLIQSEKMAAMGRLVLSVAHEVNNPLQAVQIGLSLIHEELTEDEISPAMLLEYLNTVSDEITRLGNIVTRMRDFYKPVVYESIDQPTNHKENVTPNQANVEKFYAIVQQSEALNLVDVLDSVFLLIKKHLQTNRIHLHYTPPHNLPFVKAQAGYLKQVFLNLILNALDSMTNSGDLIVKIYHQPQTNPTQIAIEFTDTGDGIPPDILPHIFEPLFTTKHNGSGLGLFTCYNIIEAHGGQIEAKSEVGLGTTFTITLPTYDMLKMDVV